MGATVKNWKLDWDDAPKPPPRPWTWLSLAAVLLAIPLWLSQHEVPRAEAAEYRALPPGYDLLRSRLLALRAALTPHQREEVLEALRAEPAQLVPPLLWVLERPRHQLFAASAALACELGVADAIEPLTDAANGGPHRAAALQALDGLQPLSDDDLAIAGAAAMEDAELAAAVLAIVGARSDPSEALVQVALGLLRHGDARIRALVPTVLPLQLSATCTATVLDLADDAEAGADAARLLPRLDPTPATLGTLVERLQAAEPEQQEVLLAALDHQTATKAVADVAWQLATGDGPQSLRAAALSALERCRDARPLPESAADWPPLLRYHAARLRIAGGHKDGVQSLVALLDEDPTEIEAIGATRILLSRMSHLPPHARAEQFVAWSADVSEVPVESLRD